MSGYGEKFGRKKEIAISALFGCPTLKEAAAQSGISESTLRRWLHNEPFARRYREERARVLDSTIDLLRQKTAAAVETPDGIMRNPAESAIARVSAARTIIKLAFKGAEGQELGERITELEALAEGARMSIRSRTRKLEKSFRLMTVRKSLIVEFVPH